MEIKNPHTYRNKKHHLETIGLMASGIAHDFNNLLTSIVGQTSLALANLPPENEARKHIERVVKAAEYGTSLTNQLLKFANDQNMAVEKANINDLILNNQPLFQMFLEHNVQLVLELEPELPALIFIRSQIQQVLMNLIINAVHAIGEDNGHIVVRTDLFDFSSSRQFEFINGRSLIPGHYVTIEVEDTGKGMDRLTMNQVFNPFFSTKASGRGLGLTNSLEIIHQHNGTIQFHSTPNVGTKAIIFLPAYLNLSTIQ